MNAIPSVLESHCVQRMNQCLAVVGIVATAFVGLSGCPVPCTAGVGGASSAATEARFRDLCRELVETNTTLSSGSRAPRTAGVEL